MDETEEAIRIGEIMNVQFEIPPRTEYERVKWDMLHSNPEIVTASQLPVVLGMSPYETAYNLWLYKTLRATPKPTTIAMRRGHAMEPLIHELYEEQTGASLKDAGDYGVYHAEFEEDGRVVALACTPDRFASTGHVVEMKAPMMRPGPEELSCYRVQLQCQMRLTGWPRGRLAILAGNGPLDIIEVPPVSDGLWREWIRSCADFVLACTSDTPLDKWYLGMQKRPDSWVFPPGTKIVPDMALDASEYRHLTGLIGGLDEQRESVRKRLLARMLQEECDTVRAARFTIRHTTTSVIPNSLQVDDTPENREQLSRAAIDWRARKPYSQSRLIITSDNEETDNDSSEA
jgi:hypothetical protein